MKVIFLNLLILISSLVIAEEYNEDAAYEVVVEQKGPMGFEIGTGIVIFLIDLHRKWMVNCFTYNSR